jgi:predicted methyltransferase MtxX (methanogen marker protein 4)
MEKIPGSRSIDLGRPKRDLRDETLADGEEVVGRRQGRGG